MVQGPKITYVSDVEGHWPYFCSYVERSEGLRFARGGDPLLARTPEDLELVLEDDWFFVFGGDCCDKGPGTLRFVQALVMLKKKYPERVTLIMGNRDVNKMRWTAELADSELELDRVKATPAVFWMPPNGRSTYLQFLTRLAAAEQQVAEDAVTDDMLIKFSNKSNKLRYLLNHDMGSLGEFEYRRKELAFMQDVGEETISDDDVVRSYEESLAPGGCLREYLELGQLAKIIGPTLFVHGQIMNGTDPSNAVPCIGVVPGHEHIPDLRQWVSTLNAWAASQIQEWIAKPYWGTPPSESTREAWADRGASEIISYGTPAARVPSVIYSRYLTKDSMPLAYPPAFASMLVEEGLQTLVVGHTPHGNAPTVVKMHDDFTLIMADTSFSHMKANLAFQGDNRGRAVGDIKFDGNFWKITGQTEKKDQCFSFNASNPCALGKILTCPASGKDFFLKAPLQDDNFLLSHIKGFAYEYALCPQQQMKMALALNTDLWLTSYMKGSEISPLDYTHYSAIVDALCGDRALFAALDLNGDGLLTVDEVLNCLLDRSTRFQMQSLFPKVDMAELFANLGKLAIATNSLHVKDFVLACSSSTPKKECALSAVVYPVVPQGEGYAEGSFPQSLQAFDMVPTKMLRPEKVSLYTGEPEKWMREGLVCTVDLSEAKESVDLLRNFASTANTHVSALRLVTVDQKGRDAMKIPEVAKYYVWVYGLNRKFRWKDEPLLDMTLAGDVAFAHYGGFMYFDANLVPVHINGCVPRSGGNLHFGMPEKLDDAWVKQNLENHKLEPVSVKYLLEAGASEYRWMPADDSGAASCGLKLPYGGFAYCGRWQT
eukprot:TRINITY_DN105834_c0_g1_i1.p1 TRINITY_DN105834_c0_g1~~TRINITY_DN105834_c0_g1_i1.p1  ORF type:complete len:876 (-),score=170.27 TRINITY_DN105834_c0_g1_i1:123-2606(-)